MGVKYAGCDNFGGCNSVETGNSVKCFTYLSEGLNKKGFEYRKSECPILSMPNVRTLTHAGTPHIHTHKYG